jgi:acetyl-CoA C-acetyltransferase
MFSSLSTPALGKSAIKGALEDARVAEALVEEVFMGCVLSAGLGQASGRQAALGAGLPVSVPCSTINKVCGSGMKAVALAHDAIQKGLGITLGGGMENMTRAPYLLAQGRQGYRLGHGTLIDHVFYDGLEDAYEPGTLMGVFADRTAEAYNISREDQDAFAARSVARAREAIEAGWFESQIIPVPVPMGKETKEMTQDEPPYKAMPEKLPRLKAIFSPNGTVTAGSSSSNADGAAALILASAEAAKKLQARPRAAIVGIAQHSQEPQWFTTAPVGAIKKLLAQLNWNAKDVDLWEINEAFAIVSLAAMKDLNLSADQVNVHGGACALGHPIGASGARVLVTLLGALEHRSLRRGIAAVCIGGGEAIAMAIDRQQG